MRYLIYSGLILFSGWPFYLVEAKEVADKPNVLLIFIDDLGKTDIGIEGSSFYETPRIDALAKSGARFTQFYSAHPVCSPTRAALMTGKMPQRLGITDWIRPESDVALPQSEVTIGQAFQEAGYHTAYLGKWHLGHKPQQHPAARGFDWTKGVNQGGQPSSYYFPYKNPQKSDAPNNVPDFENCQPEDYLTDVLTSSAIEHLQQRDRQRPFFMCLAHYAVHTPIQPPKNLVEKYQVKLARQKNQESSSEGIQEGSAISRSQQDHPASAAMVENLDTQVGRLLDELKTQGILDQTIVVFTSDNGGLCTLNGKSPGPTCNLPLRAGKGWTYEGGIRIPTYISWPGKISPQVLDIPAYTCDIYPTLLSLCRIPPRPTQHVDGISLAGWLTKSSSSPESERTLVWYYPHTHGSGHKPSAAIRQGPWKLIHFLETDSIELYHLEDDPGESRNLASKHPERALQLQKELQKIIESSS